LSGCQCGHLTAGAFEGNILPIWKYLKGDRESRRE
jgi:hypothetical protein